jgi:hypothetical protein
MSAIGIDNQSPMQARGGNRVAALAPGQYSAAMDKAQRVVHIYNIANKEFNIARTLYPRLTLAPCPEDERYIKVFAVRHPYPEFWTDADGNQRITEHIAEVLAMDIVNPDSVPPNLDQNSVSISTSSSNNNLNQQGLFWSNNEPPTEEELKAAEKRLENRYRTLLQKVDAVAHIPAQLQELIVNQDYHKAAAYFGAERPWTSKITKKTVIEKMDCPNCGDEIRKGAAFHKTEEGICVVDWKRTVESGIRKKSDVPEGLEWWEPELVAEPESPSVPKAKKEIEIVPSYMNKGKK